MTCALIPRAALFGSPNKTSGRISPDGGRLSWLAPLNGVLNVWVAPFDAPHDAQPVTDSRVRGIPAYAWTYDGRHLLYFQDEAGDENYHIFSVEPDTGAKRDLTPYPGVAARLTDISRRERGRVLIGLNHRDVRYRDLHVLDLASGDMTLVEENRGFEQFVTDEHYRAHLAVRPTPEGGWDLLQRRAGADWAPWMRFGPEDARVSYAGHLDRTNASLFLHDSRGRDTAALVRVNLATDETTLIAAHDKADIGSVLTDLESLEPLAYSVLTDRLQHVAVDPRIQTDLDFLDGQDIGDWYLLSRTDADDRWIVAADSDTRPSVSYLYDRQAATLRELFQGRPALKGAPLAAMKPVTIRARDGLDLVSYVTIPKDAPNDGPSPMVLLVHGGPWGRDQFGFDPRHQWLANRGYAVLSVNFRGSTGFGKSFVNAGDREWGRRMDDDLIDAVAWAIDRKIADPQRIAIMGWSYGGYATLVGLTRNPGLYACGLDIVGPSNLETLMRTMPPYWEAIRAQLYRAIGDPDTEDGLRLARERSPLFQAHRVAKPLLIAQGANDPRVKQAESDQMVAALKANGIPVTYLLFPDEGHGLARPENSIAFFAIAESFLARHLGGRAEPIGPGELAASTVKVLEGAVLPPDGDGSIHSTVS